MSENMSVDQAAEVMRSAMRDVIKRHSILYMLQGALMVFAGLIALIFPVFSSVAVIVVLGWLLILSGIFQGISLIGATHVPHFWLQLISVTLSILIGVLFVRNPSQGLLTLTMLLIVFFMWVKTTDWVSRDAQEMKLPFYRCNAIVFGTFLVAMMTG